MKKCTQQILFALCIKFIRTLNRFHSSLSLDKAGLRKEKTEVKVKSCFEQITSFVKLINANNQQCRCSLEVEDNWIA